ncbi:MAG: hypothetical protein H7A25_24165, partial [Leptospiraceae bacterium]|nr:hypothetical protein [Leptospiraceae bacterium]
MVFLDACRETLRAGKAGGGKSFSADFLPKSVKEGQGVGVLVGTNPGGYSYEDPDLGGGVFTHFLIKGISGEVQDRGGEYVTFNDLKTYVEEKMKFYTRNTKDRHEQIPYFKGDLTGDFLIAVGRPDKTFRVESRKFRNSVGLAIDAKILLDGQNRMQRLSFHSITEGGEILPNNLDGISYMIYEHGTDKFVSKQFNAEGELEFVHGVKKTEKGWEIKRVYHADESGLIRNAVFTEEKDKQSGILYQRLEFDFNGNPILNEYQGKFDKSPEGVFIPRPLEDKEGISRIVQNFDLLSNKTLEEYYNASRELKPNKFGIARSVYAYDSYGNPLLVSYLNENSERATDELGISNIAYKYDYTVNPKGMLLSKTFYDKQENLKPAAEGIARYVYKYNKACLEKEQQRRGGFDSHYKEWSQYKHENHLSGKRECLELEEYYITKDKKIAREKLKGDWQGIARKVYKYDKNCLKAGKKSYECYAIQEYYGKDGKLKENRIGIARYVYRCDEKGNRTLEEYYDKDEKLKEDSSGIARYVYRYDDKGNKISSKYYNKEEIEVSQYRQDSDKSNRFWFSPERNYVFQENLERAFEERWVSRPEGKRGTKEAQAEFNSEDSKPSPPKKDKDMVKEKISYYVVTGGEHH